MLKYGYVFNVNIKLIIFQASLYKNKIVLRVNCFNVEFYRWINVDKSTLKQRGYHVDQRRDIISTYINVECLLGKSSCPKVFLYSYKFLKVPPTTLLKKTAVQMFSCEFCDIFKKKYTLEICQRLFLSCYFSNLKFFCFHALELYP